jgi:hypothetical protein
MAAVSNQENARLSRRSALGLFALTAAGLTMGRADATPPGSGIRTFAMLPAAPGFPEGVAVHGNRVFVSGPARFGTAGTGPSALQVFDRNSGALITTVDVTGEDLSQEHALSNIALDSEGRIYALSTQLGLIRFTKQGQNGYLQEAYGDPLPLLFGPPPLPNDLVFDPAGYAYVSDSLQGAIFRYAPGGGAPQVWF